MCFVFSIHSIHRVYSCNLHRDTASEHMQGLVASEEQQRAMQAILLRLYQQDLDDDDDDEEEEEEEEDGVGLLGDADEVCSTQHTAVI